MPVTDADHHRAACSVHVLNRAEQRGVDLDGEDIARTETALEKLRPCFERPGQDRYWVGLRRDGGRFRVLYDIRLGCLVIVWRQRNGVSGGAPVAGLLAGGE